MLTAEQQAEILVLHFSQKKGSRAIARILKINRKAVIRVIKSGRVALKREKVKRSSLLDPYKDQVLELLKIDSRIPVRTILDRIRERGYGGGITILGDWVKLNRATNYRPREAFLSLNFAPGECAQVDWGEFGDVFGDGIKIHCFLMVLCFSRLLYIEFTRSEKFEDFIRCHENAFRSFGGVPKECWYDNLTSAVTDRLGSLVQFNSRFMAYMGHHRIRPHACNPARGNEKGRVEDGVKYIRSSFWPGRNFKDFDDLQDQGRQWVQEIANQREHRSTRKIPSLLFKSEELKALLPMNPHSYDTHEIFSKVVPPNFLITYETNKYSLPWTLVGMTITVRSDDTQLLMYYNERLVCSHERSFKKFQTFVKDSHLKGLLERKPGGTKDTWQIQAVKALGKNMSKYLELIRSGSRSIRNEVAKILALSTIYGENEVNDACGEMLEASIVGVDNLEITLKQRHHPSTRAPIPLEFQNNRLNRTIPSVDLRRYDALLFGSTKTIEASKGDNDVES